MEPPRENADILWLDTVDSTNSVLRERYPQSANLSIIAAREQTRGRGQGEHSWFSTPGKNLTFSILYRFGPDAPYLLEASHAIVITQITTLALRDYLGSRGIGSRIKWPNDIWVGERKICGILIENKVTGRYMDASIVGIGLNVNEEAWPPQLPNPVSMKASIDVLSHTSGRKIAVLGDMGELGSDEKELHYGVGRAVAESGIDVLFAAGELAEQYALGAKLNEKCEVHYFKTREEMMPELQAYVREGDAILVKASHFMEFPKVVSALTE